MKFDPEAFKHGKTQEDIDFLYASPHTEWFYNGTSDRGNYRAMLVGFDQNGNFMEAAFELITSRYEENEEYFYHAMPAPLKIGMRNSDNKARRGAVRSGASIRASG